MRFARSSAPSRTRTIALSCVALLGCVRPPPGDPPRPVAGPTPPAASATTLGTSWSAVAAGPIGPFQPVPDAEKYLPLVTNLIIQDEGAPPDGKFHVVFTAGGPRKLVLGGDGGNLTVIPVHLTFDSFTNAYCELAVLRSGTPAPGIVPLPMTDNDPGCSAMRKLIEADLNHDGMPDLVFELTVKWNRGPGLVSDGAVYLSDRDRMTYCYSESASLAISASGAYSAARAVRTIESEVRRRGPKVLECAKDLPNVTRSDGGV